MRTPTSVILGIALFAAGCGGGGDGQSSVDVSSNEAVPAVATPESPDPAWVNSGPADLDVVSRQGDESVYTATPAGIAKLLKLGDTLFLSGASGLVALTPTGTRVLADEPVVTSVIFADRLWLATEGALATVDGLVKIVPEFATAFTSLAVYGEELYAGTAGNGVWKLEAGKLVPISEDWQVRDLAATEFGLFAATDAGLFSYQDDRWHSRRLSDSSAALDVPTVLYSRYPYLYVGTGSDLISYDGGQWQQFGLNVPVSALGWHDARLYIGTSEGELLTLEGGVAGTVSSPEAGAIRSILRFDGRLHVAAEGGVFRQRHGRFDKVEWDESAESEPKHEPIAFLL